MKRTMKRIALLLTVMCLAVSLIPCASAKHFYDVPSSIGEVYAEGESFNLFGGAIGKSEPSKTNSSVSNDMPIYGLSMIPEGDSCTYLILTTPSDTFTCNATDTSEVTGFYAEGANLSFSAVASSDDSTLILHTDDSENLS